MVNEEVHNFGTCLAYGTVCACMYTDTSHLSCEHCLCPAPVGAKPTVVIRKRSQFD